MCIKKLNFFSQFFATCYLPTLFHTWQSKCFFLLSVQSKFCGKLCSTYKIQAFPIRNSNLNIVSAYPPSGRNMVTFMTLKNSKLVMVKFIWQLLFWHSYRRLLSQKRKSASWDIPSLKERRISVLSKGRKKMFCTKY